MKRKALAVVITLALALSVSGTTSAKPASSGTTSLKTIQNEKQQLERKIELLDSKIVSMMAKIDSNKKEVSKTQENMKVVENNLKKAENNIKSQQELFDKRMRVMYINGTDSYFDVILSSKGLSDFVSRVETVKKVVQFDKKVISNLKDKKQNIVKQKEDLNAKKSRLLALKKSNEEELAKLNKSKASQEKTVKDLDAKEKRYATEIYNSPQQVAARKTVNSAKNSVNKIRNEAPKYNPSRGSASFSSSSVVAYASNFMGTPYEWAGNGPNSFDCSGFTKYVFAHFGVSLPRVASGQQGVGTPVSRGSLQPGDLVFFGSPAHHVGIYVGNNSYIHAPRTGDVVKISPLTRSDFSGGRRVR